MRRREYYQEPPSRHCLYSFRNVVPNEWTRCRDIQRCRRSQKSLRVSPITVATPLPPRNSCIAQAFFWGQGLCAWKMRIEASKVTSYDSNTRRSFVKRNWLSASSLPMKKQARGEFAQQSLPSRSRSLARPTRRGCVVCGNGTESCGSQ